MTIDTNHTHVHNCSAQRCRNQVVHVGKAKDCLNKPMLCNACFFAAAVDTGKAKSDWDPYDPQ